MAASHTDLVMVCAGDLAGQLRGKAVPRRALDDRRETGIGWTPTNVFITSFGPIAPSPWGALGDLLIRPDFSALVDLDLPDWGVRESFVLGDILDLDGTPWACCPRGRLKAAVARLKERHGLTLRAAFEHEFHYSGTEAQPGLGYALRALRRMGDFPDRLMKVLDLAGLDLDTFMPEYGPGQCEVTIGPQPALRAADEAAILRELTRGTARGLGARASFAPILDPDGVGNGVHVHFSLLDSEGTPVNHDSAEPFGVSRQAGAFLAGVLRHLPELLALTAPAVVSYLRLTPHRWSAAYTNLGNQDREAALRICPVFGRRDDAALARGFHFEFRAADAAATPHLVLAAIINAGLAGLDDDLPTPPVTEADLSTLDPDALADLGCERLPQSLAEALDRLAASDWAQAAFGETLVNAFVRHKRTEVEVMEGMTEAEMCGVYGKAY